jgi:hypothetical protein
MTVANGGPFTMIILKSGDELANLLKKALQIEEGLETVAQWEAYISAKNYKFRKMIFEMLSESEQNKSMIEEMLRRVKVSGPHEVREIKPHVFDVQGKEDQEVMDELYDTELLMLNTYTLIRETLKGVDLDQFIDPKDQEFFLTTLNTLITQGEDHAASASSHRGSVQRIR